MVLIIGDVTLTTGILRRVRKFGMTLCFMTLSLKLYCIVGSEMQGNVLLHKKQYEYSGLEIARHIIKNKIDNQIAALRKMRSKLVDTKEAIGLLESYFLRLNDNELELREILGIEGLASKVYFPRLFNNVVWKGRKPRIKFDYVNALLDIGYNVLFNFVDAILQIFGFDVYYGVLHTCFYMRKSLVCDIIEPFRPIVDWQIRKSINLGQFSEKDFIIIQGQFQLAYDKSSRYVRIFLEAILERKEDIFLYIRDYYRSFMKGKRIDEYPFFRLEG